MLDSGVTTRLEAKRQVAWRSVVTPANVTLFRAPGLPIVASGNRDASNRETSGGRASLLCDACTGSDKPSAKAPAERHSVSAEAFAVCVDVLVLLSLECDLHLVVVSTVNKLG